ncbi:DnaJ domain-containing protein [Rhodospira trueperi]|uniref:DnaJ domain-containing protein n=1 Tax=Rhodospira trueperi TaxID=69960 RepID=A0A1G7C0N9_9PROT|nr:DnaJ domain-containing protein [Rhodospira trueperi]SDE32857.1 DnaJ domain-containing protein [Rhodospira trueperi]
MSHVVRDPKGYYIMLGIPPTADLASIKRAYRARSKLLHPDRNPSPHASAEFHALNEAYRVLADPAARHAYDTGRTGHETTRPAPRPAPGADGAALTPRTCRVCGRATADLRYLVLHRVRGAGLRVRRQPITGVFCRAHGDRMAVAASLYCWALGWWALPWGPVATLAALWRNLGGGEAPPRENFELLAFQARAFLARGNLPMARTLTEQARPFARTDAERHHITQLLEVLADQPAKRARGRGFRFGSAQIAQLAPLLLIAAVALYIAGPSKVIGQLLSAVPETTTGAPPPPAPEPSRKEPVSGPFIGRTTPADPAPTPPPPPEAAPMEGLYVIGPDSVEVRRLPAPDAGVAGTLSRGTVVMVTEVSRDGAWSRVLSARGISGFVPSAALTTDDMLR